MHQYRQTPVGVGGVYGVLLRLAPALSKVFMPLCSAQAARTNNFATAAPLASPRRIFKSIIGTLCKATASRKCPAPATYAQSLHDLIYHAGLAQTGRRRC